MLVTTRKSREAAITPRSGDERTAPSAAAITVAALVALYFAAALVFALVHATPPETIEGMTVPPGIAQQAP